MAEGFLQPVINFQHGNAHRKVTLRAVDFTAICAVTANVDTTAAAAVAAAGAPSVLASLLTVELMTSGGYIIDGFSKDNATAVLPGISNVSLPLTWATTSTGDAGGGGGGRLPLPPKLAAEGVMLRAHLRGGARLYGLTLHKC